MEKMWTGRFQKPLNEIADAFNASISVDSAMYRQDITGSIAHAAMLGRTGILQQDDVNAIIAGLGEILADLESGALQIDLKAEDIHMFVEGELTRRIGAQGKMLHTARSRNDQVAVDLRLYLREETGEVIAALRQLLGVLVELAQKHSDTIMPGYTHLQRAQPITFAHHLLAYGMMFARDITRLQDALRRMNVSPLGSCALAGTTYPIDREDTAAALGFDGYTLNSIDGVSDRDFCVELESAYALIMMHLSRFCEEILLWSSWEYGFVELDDSFTTGSSIMPQKKNSDMAELVRGKTGRVYGNLMGTLTMLKGLPLAYNKDMQEDKEAVFDSLAIVRACLAVFTPMVQTMQVKKETMYQAAQKGFLNATDLADYLTRKGMPFREAYKITGELVAYCIAHQFLLETLPLAIYQQYSPLFAEDLYQSIALDTCVQARTSQGGTAAVSLQAQIDYLKGMLA